MIRNNITHYNTPYDPTRLGSERHECDHYCQWYDEHDNKNGIQYDVYDPLYEYEHSDYVHH